MIMKRFLMPMFDGDGKGGSAQSATEPTQTDGKDRPPATEFDYEKLANIVAGKQSVAEDTVLKNFFKAKGLSKEEAESAILAFKEKKKAQEPDVTALQSQAQEANMFALNMQMENKALLLASEMGVDMKTIPYLVKLADKSQIITDGKVNNENLQQALEKVLEDLPQLRAEKKAEKNAGFVQVGAGRTDDQSRELDETLADIFGNKK